VAGLDLEHLDLDELNRLAREWLDQTANPRVHRTTHCVPFERWKEEPLLPLPVREYALELVETRKSHKDCYLEYRGNRYSVPFQYACRELTVRAQGDTVRLFHGETLLATHLLCRKRGQLVTDPAHFAGISHPAYPTNSQAVQERFLTTFPQTEGFMQGVVRTRGGNTTYHLSQILALTELYPLATVQAAVVRAQDYGAFNARTVRNIPKGRPGSRCQSESALALIPPQTEVAVSAHSAVLQEVVERRPLSRYSQVVEAEVLR
jgi:hypothetical protein